ncbi:hypothetical protein ACQCSV_02580 [Pseudarthrobacter sp. S3]|uniref:hypothetical protein n=1 Tax=Pseudarthrobacter sp. S3 TaxID=3418419 RepID=UPI0034921DCE
MPSLKRWGILNDRPGQYSSWEADGSLVVAAGNGGVDAVITSAAGYPRHRKADTPETDAVGNINLVGAATRSGKGGSAGSDRRGSH